MLIPLFNFLIATIPCICIYFYLKKKDELEKEYAEKLKDISEAVGTRVQLDPEESQTILQDFRSRGFTVVRIDTNDIFYRSPKG